MTALESLNYNVLYDGDNQLKGKLAEMLWVRMYKSKLSDAFVFLSSSMLTPSWGGRRLSGKEPRELDIYRMREFLNKMVASDVFSTEDVKFILTEVAHGRGPPGFDYVGIEKANKKKAMLDVKSSTKTRNLLAFSSNERKVMMEAKNLGFDIYVAFVAYLKNWDTEIKLTKL